jgi:anti-anti-sigma regulatory factor
MRNLVSSLWRSVKNQLLPHSSEPEAAQREYVLNLILLGLAGPGFLFGLAATALWALNIVPSAAVGALAGFGVQPFYVLAYCLARWGRVHLASHVPLLALFLVMLGGSWRVGVGHATLVGFAMIVMLAGALVGIRTTAAYVLLCTGVYGVVGWLQLEGRLASPVSPQDSLWADGVALALGLIAVAISSRLVIWQWHAVLRHSLAQLQYQNRELEAVYEERQRLTDELQVRHEEQKQLLEALRQLSSSLIPVTDEILIMPVAGAVDSDRMEQIAAGLLDGLAGRRARVVIADLTGVSQFDADAVAGLLEVTQAVRLLGCELFWVGMPLHVAGGLAGQESSLRKVIVLGDLQDGIARALAQLGQQIVPAEQSRKLQPGVSSKAEVRLQS